MFGAGAIVAIPALLAIFVAYYRLGPLRALAAFVLVVAGWLGSLFLFDELLNTLVLVGDHRNLAT